MKHRYIALLLPVVLAGCAPGSGEGLNANGQPFQVGDDAPLAAQYKSIQDNVFTPICTVCHAGASAPVGLQLDVANSYGMLVGVDSVQQPGTKRIEPGDPNASYLIAKIEGIAGVGAQMPLGGPVLPQATIDIVRQWVTDGALPPTTTPPPVNQPPTVISTTPADGAALTQLPTSINIVFSHELDASTVTGSTINLVRSGGDGSFSDGNEVSITPASVAISSVNTTLVSVDLSSISSVDDSYRLTLVGTGAASLQDLNANVLDGDNDGVAGGDYNANFTVASLTNTLQPSWRSIQDNVFTPICIVCHAGTSAPENLQLNEANSYTMLVNTPSAQEPSFMRVAPGNPDNSYIIQKLEGTAASGSRMPQGGPFLDQASIDIIRQWISDGAANENSGSTPDAVLVPTLNVQASVVSGDEFPVSVSIENTGLETATAATVTLSWSTADNLTLREGETSQALASLNASESSSIDWVMRGRDPGLASITITVTESNGAFSQESADITVTE